MAEFMKFTPEQQAEFDRWLAEKPPVIQEMVRKLPPNRLYRNKDTGQRMTIISYNEEGTVAATVSGKFNKCMYERNVFGIHVDQLEECDLPGPDEELGAVLTTQEEVDAFIEMARPHVLKARGLI